LQGRDIAPADFVVLAQHADGIGTLLLQSVRFDPMSLVYLRQINFHRGM